MGRSLSFTSLVLANLVFANLTFVAMLVLSPAAPALAAKGPVIVLDPMPLL